jgi:biopolymer transport protein ExbD
MAMANTQTPNQPMMEINTTPLIDVMLVLLIMFIITIPVATNSIEFNTPAPVTDPAPYRPDPVVNRVALTSGGAILWNGNALSEAQLAILLDRTRQMKPEPELHFQPDATASYDLSARILRTIKASGVTKFGFVGNESYAEFGKAAAPK